MSRQVLAIVAMGLIAAVAPVALAGPSAGSVSDDSIFFETFTNNQFDNPADSMFTFGGVGEGSDVGFGEDDEEPPNQLENAEWNNIGGVDGTYSAMNQTLGPNDEYVVEAEFNVVGPIFDIGCCSHPNAHDISRAYLFAPRRNAPASNTDIRVGAFNAGQIAGDPGIMATATAWDIEVWDATLPADPDSDCPDSGPCDEGTIFSNDEGIRRLGLNLAFGVAHTVSLHHTAVDSNIDLYVNGVKVDTFKDRGGSAVTDVISVGNVSSTPGFQNMFMDNFSIGAFVPPTLGMACDFNSDTECNDVDIDLLAAAVRNNTIDSKFNVDGIGGDIPDDDDFAFYITDDSMLSTGFGDGNLDMIVNFVDFVQLSNAFGMSGSGWGEGNYNTDNNTNFNDFVLLSNNFGTSFASGSNVPEPAAISALGVLTLVWLRKRR